METKDPNANAASTPPRPMAVGPDGVVGELMPDAKDKIVKCQRRQQELTFLIGQIEVQKQRHLQEFYGLSQEAQEQINAEAARLGIPDGMPWQITPEGKAVIMPQQQPPQMRPQGPPPGPQAPGMTELPPKGDAKPPEEPPEEPKSESPEDEGGASE